MNKVPNPVVRRSVIGEQALAAAVLHLSKQSCWFEVEPFPFDVYRITVKPDAANHLPAARNWAKASEQKLLDYAATLFGDEFASFEDGEVRLVACSKVAYRNEDETDRSGGFSVMAEVWVNYPENMA